MTTDAWVSIIAALIGAVGNVAAALITKPPRISRTLKRLRAPYVALLLLGGGWFGYLLLYPEIRITQVPPYDPQGGENTRADIAGEVSAVSCKDSRVVLYALTNRWYVQPEEDAGVIPVTQECTWSHWTHTGAKYAALLVRQGFEPPSEGANLPAVGGAVRAMVVVTGKKVRTN